MKIKYLLIGFLFSALFAFQRFTKWESRFVQHGKNGKLEYKADEKGNILPDFSRVGYENGDVAIPEVNVVKTISPVTGKSGQDVIQLAIDEVSKMPMGKNGFRGAILLKKGRYDISENIRIEASGIVLRGEGNDTKLVATGTTQRAMIRVDGKGSIRQAAGLRTKITDEYVPVGSRSFTVNNPDGFKAGDSIILYRPATEEWIQDLKMDQIEERNGTKQWKASEYNLSFERKITRIEGNKIFIDNPVVMQMEPRYGGGEIFKYSFNGRIGHIGIENLYCESEFLTDTSENHGWDAIHFDKVENGWVKNVTSKYFGYSCVNLDNESRNITVTDCCCFDAKSVITGGRRYSFNNNGQMNLFMNCQTTEGRHDYVTGAKTLGPNVFYNCSSLRTHADIGPHHRWSAGTLYDNITTDGEINIQDRGNYGSGHGWTGITQVLWNCKAKAAAVQSPYVNGKNYCIGLKGKKSAGRFKDRPDGEWEGQNKDGLEPASLYAAQYEERTGRKVQ
jgi:hypothetical protein